MWIRDDQTHTASDTYFYLVRTPGFYVLKTLNLALEDADSLPSILNFEAVDEHVKRPLSRVDTNSELADLYENYQNQGLKGRITCALFDFQMIFVEVVQYA